MDRNLHNFALVVFDGLDVVRCFGHWGTHCRFAARNRSLSSCKAVRWSPPLAPRPTDVGWRLTFIETWKIGGINGVPNSTYAALRSGLPCHDKLSIRTAFPCSRRACLRPALRPIRWPIPALPQPGLAVPHDLVSGIRIVLAGAVSGEMGDEPHGVDEPVRADRSCLSA